MKPTELFELLKETGIAWYEDKTSRLGAALAYYTVFSLAPVLLIAVAMASFVFGERAAQGHLAEQMQETVGPRFAGAVQDILGHTHATGSGTLAAILSVVVLVFSATAVFGQLQDGLNTT